MKSARLARITATSCLFAAATPLLGEPQPVGSREVSEDGLTSAALPSRFEPGSVTTRGTVPLPSTPNWQLNLRRQVGAVRVADMNGDGLRDIVVGCFNSSAFPAYTDWHDMIFFNQGGGAFSQLPGWISTDQTHTGDIQVGDVNLDGRLDVLAVSGGGAFSAPRIYYGGSSGGPTPNAPSQTASWFASPPQAGWATSGSLFDADNDGDLDIITTNQGVSPNPFRPMYFWRNLAAQGGGLPTSPVWSSTEASIQNTVATTDFDGDGLPEIGVAKWVNFRSGLYENNSGTPTLTPPWEATTTSGDRGVAWADVDGNGWPDLMIGGASSSIQSRLYSNTAGVLTLTWSAALAFVGQQEVAFSDINHDGRPDYAEVHFSNGQTHIFLNEDGTLHSTPDWTFDAPEVGNALDFGDVNGDGRPDLVVGYSGDISVRVFFAVPPPCPADINSDGVINTLDLTFLLQNFGQTVAPGTGGDLNGDGTVNTLDLTGLLQAFGSSCP